VVAVAHGFNDAYAAFVHPLLPRLMGRFGLTIAMAATLAMAFSLASSVFQPLLGYLADRHGRRVFLVGGALVVGCFSSMLGSAPSFGVLVTALLIAGLGSAAFHPPGAAYAARVSDGRGSGARYSLFSFGGAAGYAMGPLVAVWIVQSRGLQGLWIAMIPILVLSPVLYFNLPSARSERPAHPPPAPGAVLGQLAGPLGLVFGVSAAMAWAQRAFLTMVPIIVARTGGSETVGAVMLSVYLGAQAFGTVAGGLLTDRMDRRRMLMGLCGLALPAHLVAVGLPVGTTAAFAAAAFAGFLGMATLPGIVVIAQELIPGGAGVGSGIVMGLAWATGSVGVLVTGAAADVMGPLQATLLTMPVILIAVAFSSHRALSGRRVLEL
jgi:FSR family fosmidomycin resistance protein-like MFS transporter